MVNNLDFTVTGKKLADKQALVSAKNGQPTLNIRFLTMTRLKYAQEYTTVPEFHILIRNILRRISSISYFHHGIELQLDFRELIQKAQEKVFLVKNETHWEDWERYSSRQDTKMNLGGIVGEAVYQGDWSEFWPLLKIAEEVHIGKGTVFGMGKIMATPNA